MADFSLDYFIGLCELLDCLGKEHPRYSEVLVYESRLKENLDDMRLYGDTDTRKAERAEIVAHLNDISMSIIGISYNELCDKAREKDTQQDDSKGQKSFIENIFMKLKTLPVELKVTLWVAVIGAVAAIIAPMIGKPDIVIFPGASVTPDTVIPSSSLDKVTPMSSPSIALAIQEMWPKQKECQLGGTWKVTLWVQPVGGNGVYTYYNNGNWVIGPISAGGEILLIGESEVSLEGTITVESNDSVVSRDYVISPPDCE